MFDISELRGSIWKARVNTFVGSLFLGACALWAALFIIQLGWGVNPLTEAFAKAVAAEITPAD